MSAAVFDQLLPRLRPCRSPFCHLRGVKARQYATAAASPQTGGTTANHLRLVILGAPGAGKGTHTDSLLRKYDLQSLVVGNLLREEVAKGSAIGVKAAKVMKEGGLLDDATILSIVKPSIGNLTGKSWILVRQNIAKPGPRKLIDVSAIQDGYPRTAQQAHDLDAALGSDAESVNLVVNLDVPDEVLVERIENRWVHIPSGRIYNTTYNPPKKAGFDDVTGEALGKRIDDDVDIFKRRLSKFHKENTPIKEYYVNKGTLVNLSGRTR